VFGTDDFGRVTGEAHRLSGLPAMQSGAFGQSALAPYLKQGQHWRGLDFDAVDNIAKLTDPSGVTVPNRGPDERLTSWNGTVSTDPEGNITAEPKGSSYAYDGFGQLVFATKGTSRYTFSYDAFGRLTGYHDGKTNHALQYAGDFLLRDVAGGKDTTLWVPGADGLPLARHAAGSVQYFLYGPSGDVEALIDNNGVLLERYEYDAHHAPKVFSASGAPLAGTAHNSRRLVAGQLYFEELGLQVLGRRWYRPDWGQFVSADPAGFADGPNRYSFVRGQLLSFHDPTGLSREDLDPSIGGSRHPQGWVDTASAGSKFGFLDGVQLVLDGAGFLPGIGIAADLVNAGIHLARGNYVEAGMSAFSALPLVGDFGKAAVIATKYGAVAVGAAAMVAVAKASDNVLDVAVVAGKHGDAVVSAGTHVAKHGDEALSVATHIGKQADEAVDVAAKKTTKYARPSGATTPAQRASVQGKPCVDCGTTGPKMYADHKAPLVKQHYEGGGIDKGQMRSPDAVQPQCPTCSNRQGADLSRYSREKAKELGLE
jgi:RHS repeat-associated protein